MMEMNLIENLQREDLNPIDKANGFKALMEECNFTQEEVSVKLGIDRTAIANFLRLLKLPDKVKDLIRDGKLSEGQCRAILMIKTPEQQEEFAGQIVSEDLTIRQIHEILFGKQKRKVVIKGPDRT